MRDYQLRHGDSKFPPFVEFVKFITEIAEIHCLPVLTNLDTNKFTKEFKSRNPKTRPGKQRSDDANTLATGADKEPMPKNEKKVVCHCCSSKSHDLELCPDFLKKPRNERILFIIKRGLCLNCFTHAHMAKESKCEKEPSCKKCRQKHLTCLHVDTNNRNESRKPVLKATVNCTGTSNAESALPYAENVATKCTVCSIEGQQLGQDQSLIVPVWVSSLRVDQENVLTYALIDCQSNATFITDKLRRLLKIDSVESHLHLSTMHRENELIQCKKVQDLIVTDLKRQVRIPLPKVYTRDTIPYKPSQTLKPEVAMQWAHLNLIAPELMPFREDIEVGLLIGTNCPKAIKPREVILGADNDLYGIRTDLGWGIVGRVCKSPQGEEHEEPQGSSANRIVTREEASFALETRTKEIISPACVNQLLERDFHEKTVPKTLQTLSVDDWRFLEMLDQGTHQTSDGHYEMSLPLYSQDVKLPNNKPKALRSLFLLKARFKRDPLYHRDYTEFMEETLSNCAKKVPET